MHLCTNSLHDYYFAYMHIRVGMHLAIHYTMSMPVCGLVCVLVCLCLHSVRYVCVDGVCEYLCV